MAEKTINTRILLKYDSYSNWTTNNPVLKAGEVAIATIASGNTQEVNSVVAPQVLIKVGDGTSAYNALPFVSAKAADVHGWAKAENKPTYEAGEITGIDSYIADYVNDQMGISVDTDTQYQIVKVDDYNYKLQSKGKTDSAWADVENGAIVIPKYDDTALAERVSANEEAIELLNGDASTAGSVAKAIADAISALDLANTYEAKGEAAKVQTALNNYQTSNDAVIAAIKDGASIDSFADVESALEGKQAVGDYATKAEAQGYADAKDEAIAAAKKAGDDAQADVDALTDRVGANETAIGVLNGTGEGSVSKTVTDAIDEFATRVSDDGTINTIRELVDYAATHGEEFSELVGEVDANTKALETLNGDASTVGSVAKTVADAIAAENLGQYATDDELSAVAGRVSTLEGEMDTAQEDIEALETEVAKKANDADLAAIAKTGNINDLVQTDGDVLIFDCGDSNF